MRLLSSEVFHTPECQYLAQINSQIISNCLVGNITELSSLEEMKILILLYLCLFLLLPNDRKRLTLETVFVLMPFVCCCSQFSDLSWIRCHGLICTQHTVKVTA